MIKTLKKNNSYNALHNEYVCDTPEDLQDIVDAPFGSTCYVISEGVVCIKGSSGWVVPGSGNNVQEQLAPGILEPVQGETGEHSNNWV